MRKEIGSRKVAKATGQMMSLLIPKQVTPYVAMKKNYLRRYFLSYRKKHPTRVYFLSHEIANILL